jgi:hypothetical protein
MWFYPTRAMIRNYRPDIILIEISHSYYDARGGTVIALL